MMHTSKCAESTEPTCDCVKGCAGKLHGWRGSQRFAPLSAGRQQMLTQERSTVNAALERVRKKTGRRSVEKTDYCAAKVAFWTVRQVWSDDETTVLVDAFAACVAPVNRIFVDELAASVGLTDSDRRRIHEWVGDGHLVCVLSVTMLRAYDAFNAALDTLAEQAAKHLAAALFPGPTEAIARAATEYAFKQAATRLAELVIDDTRILALRFIGAVSCPDWDRHPDDGIWTYCLKPAFLGALGDQQQQWAEKALTGNSI